MCHGLKKMSVPVHLQVNGKNINRVTGNSSIKFVGVHVREDLKWDNQVKELIKKLNKSFYAMKSSKQLLSKQSMRMLYHGIFASNVEYCNIVWGSTTNENLQKIEVAQKRALRMAFDGSKKLLADLQRGKFAPFQRNGGSFCDQILLMKY